MALWLFWGEGEQGIEPRAPGLSCQCSDHHRATTSPHISQSQHLAATKYVCAVRVPSVVVDQKILCQERTHPGCFNVLKHFAWAGNRLFILRWRRKWKVGSYMYWESNPVLLLWSCQCSTRVAAAAKKWRGLINIHDLDCTMLHARIFERID